MHTPVSYDEFIYCLEDGIESINTDGIVCELCACFDAEDAVTWVFVRRLGEYWSWHAMHRGYDHDAYWECAKDTWKEAAHDAYYELLKHGWL